MQLKKQKFVYWLLGLGCGIIVSGILMTIVGLKVIDQYEMTSSTEEFNEQSDAPKILQQNETSQQEASASKEPVLEEERVFKEPLVEEIEETDSLKENELKENDASKETRLEEEVVIEEKKEVDEVDKELVKERNYSIYIPSDATATSIASQLEEEGIIENGNDFLIYIKEQGKTSLLRSGSFMFPEKATYEEALNILLRKK